MSWREDTRRVHARDRDEGADFVASDVGREGCREMPAPPCLPCLWRGWGGKEDFLERKFKATVGCISEVFFSAVGRNR